MTKSKVEADHTNGSVDNSCNYMYAKNKCNNSFNTL